MENENLLDNALFGQLKSYSTIKLKLEKFKAVRKGAPFASILIICVLASVNLILGFLFGCVTLAFYLGSLLGSLLAGFGCVTALFIITGILLLLFRKVLQVPLIDMIIRKLCN